MYYADPVQHIIAAGRDLSDLSVDDLDDTVYVGYLSVDDCRMVCNTNLSLIVDMVCILNHIW